MDVPKGRIEQILQFFKPEWRYLQKATVDYPKAQGVFTLGDTPHTTEVVNHVTALEIQLCFNQLCYAAFGEWAEQGKLGYTIPFKQHLELMKENMYVLDAHLKFRKLIPKQEELYGKIEVVHTKKKK